MLFNANKKFTGQTAEHDLTDLILRLSATIPVSVSGGENGSIRFHRRDDAVQADTAGSDHAVDSDRLGLVVNGSNTARGLDDKDGSSGSNTQTRDRLDSGFPNRPG